MSSENSDVFTEKQASTRKYHPHYDDDTMDSMKEYFKLEDHEELLKYIKRHRSALDTAIS